jgi:hypothetical protein
MVKSGCTRGAQLVHTALVLEPRVEMIGGGIQDETVRQEAGFSGF